MFTSFINSVMGWSGPNKVTRTTLIHVWVPHTMDKVDSRETPPGSVSMFASAREGAAPLPAMTWCWSTRAFNTFRSLKVYWPNPKWWWPLFKLFLCSRWKHRARVSLRSPGIAMIGAQALRHREVSLRDL